MRRIERTAARSVAAAALAGALAGCAIAPPSAPPPVRDLTPPPGPTVSGAGRDGSSPRPAASGPERSRVSGTGPARRGSSGADAADGDGRAGAAAASLRPGGHAPAPQVVPDPGERRREGESVAVAALLDGARAAEEAGQYGRAAASLERALKVAPRNPRLWHRLAVIRYRQGRLAAAESLALRSLSLASSDPGLDARNWRVVAAVRQARGDRAGAEDAFRRANLR